MDDSARDELIRGLLRSVQDDPHRVSANRDRIRVTVLTEFDDVAGSVNQDFAAGPDETSVQDGQTILARGSDEQDADDLAVLDLNVVSVRGNSVGHKRGQALALVAAAVVVLAGVMLIQRGTDQPQLSSAYSTDAPAVQTARLMPEGAAAPYQLEAGTHSTQVLGGQISFTVSTPIIVVEERQGLIVLADPVSALRGSGQLTLFEVDEPDLAQAMKDSIDLGDVVAKPSVEVFVGGGYTPRWDITVLDATMQTRGCQSGARCLPTAIETVDGPIELWAGSENRLFEVERPGGSSIVVVERSQAMPGRLAALTAEITESLEFE